MSEEVLSCGCGIPLFTEEQMAEAKVAGEKEANKLLAEELSDQSVRLTDFVKESWGNDLTYEAFKVSFEVFNLILTDFQYVKLWANYRQVSPEHVIWTVTRDLGRGLIPEADIAGAIQKRSYCVNTLLPGELANQHFRLSGGCIRSRHGETLKPEDFKRILGTIGISVAAPQLAQLFQNYQGKKSQVAK